MYNPITLTEIAIWIVFAIIERSLAAASPADNRTTIVCEVFKLAGFEMRPAAEVVGLTACFVLRLFFGSSALLAAIAILTVQLSFSTLLLKHFINTDINYN